MDWQAIGAIGEILGTLAVIVTLGCLATQVRLVSRQIEVVHRLRVPWRIQ